MFFAPELSCSIKNYRNKGEMKSGIHMGRGRGCCEARLGDKLPLLLQVLVDQACYLRILSNITPKGEIGAPGNNYVGVFRLIIFLRLV